MSKCGRSHLLNLLVGSQKKKTTTKKNTRQRFVVNILNILYKSNLLQETLDICEHVTSKLVSTQKQKAKYFVYPTYNIRTDMPAQIVSTQTLAQNRSTVIVLIFRTKVSNKMASANSSKPGQEQSDQGLHCLPFHCVF